MRQWMFGAALAAMTPIALGALATPAIAQSPAAQARWDAAQRRYDQETRLFNQERDLYYSRSGNRGYGRGAGYGRGTGYDAPPPPPPGAAYGAGYDDDRYDPNYDASRYYRAGSGYQERVLAADDRVYAGSDGRYYCRRSDGTTGLIAGGAAGGVLGNVIDGGHSRTAGTLIGAAIGALAGKAIDQNQAQIRCR